MSRPRKPRTEICRVDSGYYETLNSIKRELKTVGIGTGIPDLTRAMKNKMPQLEDIIKELRKHQ